MDQLEQCALYEMEGYCKGDTRKRDNSMMDTANNGVLTPSDPGLRYNSDWRARRAPWRTAAVDQLEQYVSHEMAMQNARTTPRRKAAA